VEAGGGNLNALSNSYGAWSGRGENRRSNAVWKRRRGKYGPASGLEKGKDDCECSAFLPLGGGGT